MYYNIYFSEKYKYKTLFCATPNDKINNYIKNILEKYSNNYDVVNWMILKENAFNLLNDNNSRPYNINVFVENYNPRYNHLLFFGPLKKWLDNFMSKHFMTKPILHYNRNVLKKDDTLFLTRNKDQCVQSLRYLDSDIPESWSTDYSQIDSRVFDSITKYSTLGITKVFILPFWPRLEYNIRWADTPAFYNYFVKK